MLKQRIGEYGPDSGGRVKGVTVIKPIVFGNQARYFGKKREEDGHTHSWTVYVKPYLNGDMSVYVKKVHFRLHDSYANQVMETILYYSYIGEQDTSAFGHSTE